MLDAVVAMLDAVVAMLDAVVAMLDSVAATPAWQLRQHGYRNMTFLTNALHQLWSYELHMHCMRN